MPRGMDQSPMNIPNTGPQYPMPPFGGGYDGGMHPEPPAGHMDYEQDPFGAGVGLPPGGDPGFDFDQPPFVGDGPAPQAPPLVPPGIDLGANMPPMQGGGAPPMPGPMPSFPGPPAEDPWGRPIRPGYPPEPAPGAGGPSIEDILGIPNMPPKPNPMQNYGSQGPNKLQGPLLGR
tara:strand:- start:6742 stop:7266 length:525 start_codon:yes stop_codon:yes gene_type:complete